MHHKSRRQCLRFVYGVFVSILYTIKPIMLRLYFYYCLTFLVSLTIGCSGNVSLSGKVTYSDDGSPVPIGTVAFLKDGKIARGRIKEDGTYIVGFEKETNGLPPGMYEVFISSADKIIGKDSEGENIFEPLIDAKYTSSETSGLTLEVSASTKVYNIEVERYIPPSKGRR